MPEASREEPRIASTVTVLYSFVVLFPKLEINVHWLLNDCCIIEQ